MALGPTVGATLGTANLVLHQLLCCAAYLVFIGETVARVFALRSSAAAVVAATLPYAALRASGLTHEGRAAGLSASGVFEGPSPAYGGGTSSAASPRLACAVPVAGARCATCGCSRRPAPRARPSSPSCCSRCSGRASPPRAPATARGCARTPRRRPRRSPPSWASASLPLRARLRSPPDLRPICARSAFGLPRPRPGGRRPHRGHLGRRLDGLRGAALPRHRRRAPPRVRARRRRLQRGRGHGLRPPHARQRPARPPLGSGPPHVSETGQRGRPLARRATPRPASRLRCLPTPAVACGRGQAPGRSC